MYPTTTSRRAAHPLQSLRRLNTMLDEAFAPFVSGDENGTMTSSWIPVCDVFEDKESVEIVAEVPGVRPEDVKLSLENNLLTIRGEKRQVAEESAERVHRYERSYGSFERSFALPSTVNADDIEARYDQGLLTVTLPKAEKARPRQIEVKVS
jgi:HSP20 family protein